MIWLKQSWSWLKKNWKYVITFGIPIALSAILNLIRSNQSSEKKLDLKINAHDIDQEANKLQEEMLQEANEDLHTSTQDAFDKWTEDLEEIQGNRRATELEINTAEKATAAIKEKLNE